MRRRVLGFLIPIVLIAPGTAAADWLLSPYAGVRFAGGTTFFVGLGAEQNTFAFGSSIALLTDGGLGVEADVGFVPGFFEGVSVRSSRAITLMGNVIVAVPASLSQYGLRPYVSAGAGLMHAQASGEFDDFFSSNLFGMNVGGGAIGPLTPRTSVRFDLRYFRSLTTDQEAPVITGGDAQLSFWRGSIGLTFRF